MTAPVYLLYVGEVKAIPVDWSNMLGGDTIDGSPPDSTWELPADSPAPLTEEDSSATTSTAEIMLRANIPGDYEIVNEIVGASGQEHRRTLRIHVRTR